MRSPGRLRVALLVAVAAVAPLVAGTFAYLVATDDPPTTSSAEAGFARDMRDHHLQAILMSNIVRDASTDPTIRFLALDIATGQQAQAGMMAGWLDLWGLNQTDDDLKQMYWMRGTKGGAHGSGHEGLLADGRMPGMATAAEVERLRGLKGKDAEVLWLTLMVAHHRGGVEMAQSAVTLVDEPYERNLATLIVESQTSEIDNMNALLVDRGAPTA